MRHACEDNLQNSFITKLEVPLSSAITPFRNTYHLTIIPIYFIMTHHEAEILVKKKKKSIFTLDNCSRPESRFKLKISPANTRTMLSLTISFTHPFKSHFYWNSH